MTQVPVYKVCLLGDGETGKTTIARKVMGIPSPSDFYNPTLGVEVHPLNFDTNYGPVVLNIWDCAGQEKYGGLKEGYYIQSKSAIIFYKDRTSYKNAISFWKKNYLLFNTSANKDSVFIANRNIDPMHTFTRVLRFLTGHEDIEITS